MGFNSFWKAVPFKEKDFMSVLSVLNDFHDTENKTWHYKYYY